MIDNLYFLCHILVTKGRRSASFWMLAVDLLLVDFLSSQSYWLGLFCTEEVVRLLIEFKFDHLPLSYFLTGG